MLEIKVTTKESFDETNNKFVAQSFEVVHLEHSLATVSKWESIWEIPFLGKKEKTPEQTLSYVKVMVLEENLPEEVFQKLVDNHLGEVNDYVTANMSATTINSDPNAPASREVVTAELMYYWMVSMSIPFEVEHWHLNRFLMLVRVINLKNSPKKKMSVQERTNLNRQRQQQYNTRG